MARGRDKFQKFKPVISFIVRFYSLFPRSMQTKALIRHRKQTGNLGLVIRYALLKKSSKTCWRQCFNTARCLFI